MKTALKQALELVLSGNDQLLDIIGVTLKMSLSSSLAALLLGVPLGVLLATSSLPGKKTLIVINRTLMGLPPVVVGLLCYMLFSGVGPLRHFNLLFTVKAMIIAQIILITPIITGTTESSLAPIAPDIMETAKGLGLKSGRILILTVGESRYQLFSTYLLGFARATAEVGAVSMVGGAIAYKTNVMTTAIMNYTNMGNFTLGVALGIILLVLSLAVNITIWLIQARLTR
ncbi:MAG: ABC transporter permease [Oscillospiraceae bacterium]